jgi:hypothetical protein
VLDRAPAAATSKRRQHGDKFTMVNALGPIVAKNDRYPHAPFARDVGET